MLRLFVEDVLNEASVVTFGGQTYPKYGWAVVLAGGPGSGKGFSKDKYVCIDAKSFDVDDLKKKFARLSKTPGNKIYNKSPKHDWDFKNPDDVSALHTIVSQNNYDKNIEKSFIDSKKNTNSEILPNIIFDITGDKPTKIINKAKTAKDLGYKLSFIWVITNREEAMIRNILRDRTVSDYIFHSKHNDINSQLIDFIENLAGNYFDECWVLFASNAHAGGTSEEEEWLNDNRVIQFKKNGNSFVVTNDISKRIIDTLGEAEPNPNNLTKYVKQSDLANSIKSYGKYDSVRDYGDTKFKQEKLELKIV